MSKQKLKKIVKELKGASKMHAGQAEKIDGILKKSGPFKMKSPLYGKPGLWANIHAKRKRGETMRKKGDPGAPSEKAIRDSQ